MTYQVMTEALFNQSETSIHHGIVLQSRFFPHQSRSVTTGKISNDIPI